MTTMPKVVHLGSIPIIVTSGPGSAGKRRQEAPLVNTSDESEGEDSSPGPMSPSSCSDYESVTSPNSSTCSGPIYIRTPGFNQHGHSVISRPKIKKKRTFFSELSSSPPSGTFPSPSSKTTPIQVVQSQPPSMTTCNGVHVPSLALNSGRTESSCSSKPLQNNILKVSSVQNIGSNVNSGLNTGINTCLASTGLPHAITTTGLNTGIPTHRQCSRRRDPVPMRLRALPQSFWQQPNKPVPTLQSGPQFAPLPPLSTKEDGTDLRPVTPPVEEADTNTTYTDRNGNIVPKKRGERKLTVGNTDLLFKLFENVEKVEKKKHSTVRTHSIRRTRPTKVVPITNAKILSGEDPEMVATLSEQLFPQLSLEHSQKYQNEHTSLHLVTLTAGDRAVTLPSLNVEQNYSAMLTELVMHI